MTLESERTSDRCPGRSGRARSARAAFLLVLAGAAGSATAQELRDFCVDRPGLGIPACTIDGGRVAVELGLADWTLDRDSGGRTDTLVLGDALVRYGLTDRVELQAGWQALGIVRRRDPAGPTDRRSGSGDLRLALRANLLSPDGSDLSVALMPQLTLPAGGDAIGDGDWSAALLLPVSYELAEDVQLALTAQIAHAADEQGSGHHLAYGAVLGLDLPLSRALGATVEFAASRDEEPGERRTELLAGLSLAWQLGDSVQVDAGASVALDRDAADLQLSFGLARRF